MQQTFDRFFKFMHSSVSWRNEELEPECMCPTMQSIKISKKKNSSTFFCIIFNYVRIKMNRISGDYYNGAGCSGLHGTRFGNTSDSYFIE